MSIVVLEREAKRGGVEEEEKKRKRRSFSRRGEIRGKSNLRLRVNIQRRLHITCHFRYSRLVSGGPITVESHDPIFRGYRNYNRHHANRNLGSLQPPASERIRNYGA